MPSTTSYRCDGPNCDVLTERTPRKQWPDQWPRLTVWPSGELPESGSFCSPECALGFVDLHIGEKEADEPDDRAPHSGPGRA